MPFHAQSQVDLDKSCTNKRCIRNGVPKHTARQCKHGKHDKSNERNSEPANKKLRQAYEINPSGKKTWETAKEEVYNALAKDSQVTHKELKASTDLIE